MYRQTLTLVFTLSLLAACDKTAQTSSAPLTEKPNSAMIEKRAADAWLGKWTGPEGTHLEILEDGDKYKVAIRDLDAVRTFDAVSTQSGLSFERDGTTESITAGSGPDTGMKWLMDKSNCLVVKVGEGYCRG
jgi:uncharacterized protein (DUF2147 family)